MHVTTTGRALAAAITAARRAVGRSWSGDHRAVITRNDGAYLVASDGEVRYAELVGDADGGAAPVTYIADLATLPALKGAEAVTITPAGITADGVTMPVTIAEADHLPPVPAVEAATVTVPRSGAGIR